MFQKIENLPESIKTSRKMFVVIAKDIKPFPSYTSLYTTDPCCVWWDSYDDYVCERWPHEFPPTHFMLLSEEFE